MEVLDTIKQQVEGNTIILYMKGSPQQPQCGFSSQASQAVMSCGERFAFVNILDNPEIRATLPSYSNWPTFPQLFIKGELVGGCDIVMELHEQGELETMIKDAAASEAAE
jgi:monothiol glutaredoxin